MRDFEKLYEMLEEIDVPHEKLAVGRGKTYEKITAKKRTWTYSAVLIASICFMFVLSIRLSPTIAQSVAKIPGFSPLVDMITYDKGIKDVLTNEYYEELGIVQTENDLTVTLVGVVADESGMIISYTVDAPYDISELQAEQIDIYQGEEKIQGGISYSWFSKELATQHLEEKITVTTWETLQYEVRDYELHLIFNDEKATIFEIPFTLENDIAQKRVYNIDETIEVEGQKLTVHTVTITPLRTIISFEVDPQNTMQILSLGSIRLIDEKGEEWGESSGNGVGGYGSFRDPEKTIFIESNYFRTPEKLTLHIQDINALPKDEDYLLVDFKEHKILKQSSFVTHHFTVETNSISFAIAEDEHIHFSSAIDANGEEYQAYAYSTSEIEGGKKNDYSFYQMENPVKLYFYDYPNTLHFKKEIVIYE